MAPVASAVCAAVEAMRGLPRTHVYQAVDGLLRSVLDAESAVKTAERCEARRLALSNGQANWAGAGAPLGRAGESKLDLLYHPFGLDADLAAFDGDNVSGDGNAV